VGTPPDMSIYEKRSNQLQGRVAPLARMAPLCVLFSRRRRRRKELERFPPPSKIFLIVKAINDVLAVCRLLEGYPYPLTLGTLNALPAVLSPGFVRALPESERKKLGRAGLTPEECHKTFVRGQEIELQQLVANWLNLHGIYYEWDHTHKKTSGKLGRADFRICVPPRGLWLSAECKAAGESLSLEQATEAARLRNSGGRFVVVYSLDGLIEAIRRIEAA
jgi:hypothetical protein